MGQHSDKSINGDGVDMENAKILFLVTSHSSLGTTDEKTGVWLEELAAPYYVFGDAGYEVHISSVAGGPVPIDPKSLQKEGTNPPPVDRFLQDVEAKEKIRYTNSTTAFEATDYVAIFLPGGHGTMWDLPNSCDLARLIYDFYVSGKPVAAVCHGPVGLTSVCKQDGEPLVKGLRVTGFTNAEEDAVGLTKIVPFLLENRLRELGAEVVNAPDFEAHTVVDGNLVTGQNPASSEAAAKDVLALL